MSRPSVAIVVLNFNGTEDTLECVASLRNLTYPNATVYVVDNGSKEPPVGRVRRTMPKAVWVENAKNLGFTGGNNVGCQLALEDGADYVMLLNNDTTVDEGFIEPLVERMEADPKLGMTTPKIYFYGMEKVVWAHGARVGKWSGRSPHIGVYQTDHGQYDPIREVERITGCAMLVRRDVFEKIGFLDDRFFIYCEELDWCLRARRAGYRLEVVPESVMWHKGHRDSGRVGRPFIGYLMNRNQLLVLRNNSDFFAAGGLFALLWYATTFSIRVGSSAVKGLFTGNTGHFAYAGAMVQGMVDFWRGRWGPPPFIKT